MVLRGERTWTGRTGSIEDLVCKEKGLVSMTGFLFVSFVAVSTPLWAMESREMSKKRVVPTELF